MATTLNTNKDSRVRALRYAWLAILQWAHSVLNRFQAVDPKLIVFESFHGSAYTCSPRAVYESLLQDKRFSEYSFVWALKDPASYPRLASEPRTRIVGYDSKEYYQAFARAKYWVVNAMLPLTIAKNPRRQVMVQCWHGTPLKRLRNDIIKNTEAALETLQDHVARNNLDTKRYDYFVSPSRYASQHFNSAFSLPALGLERTLLETGFPRNDYLIKAQPADGERIKKQLGIPPGKKVVLYAPTWRDDQYDPEHGYTFDSPLRLPELRQALQDDYVLLFRLHYNVADTFDFKSYAGFIFDVSSEDNINDLYIISDVLVTDYSSVFFDYANLKRPMLFFMYDKDHYQQDLRGFYLPLEALPGDIISTQTELITALQNLTAYRARTAPAVLDFRASYNYLDDGHATERVIAAVWGL